jgi:hypothetical protein
MLKNNLKFYVAHLSLRHPSNQSHAACRLRTTDLCVLVQLLTIRSSVSLQTNARMSPQFKATDNNYVRLSFEYRRGRSLTIIMCWGRLLQCPHYAVSGAAEETDGNWSWPE